MDPIIYILIVSTIGHTEVIMQPDASACARYEKVVRNYLAEKGVTPMEIYCERGKTPHFLPKPKEKPKPVIKTGEEPPPVVEPLPPKKVVVEPPPKKVVIKKKKLKTQALRSHCQKVWHYISRGHKKWYCKNKRR